ncbi:MAG: PQQ-binding-like beta-propeller repeat protein [Deltaproteobacteria bacterium]|nr:PQQ-binding-like beta-propeller repeat protein [Deltaproteobacteria bacterium]MBK8237540.1 PQQ-binding-like beta-propeller repeat protein [Deltaproteobacteria bacterium]MBK8719867.1 PQQ-binding-like beta-propeller repeat protein [Deltaproteobacteria bacterium]MBP7291788.1 PQQ-binding-like beta-propeller repeat protein [Nannocystaceae bacterium]
MTSTAPAARTHRAGGAIRGHALVVALAGLAACTRGDEPPPLHAEGSDAARSFGVVELMRQITVPDNFILRPDEFAGVGIDDARARIYVGSREGTLLALERDRGEVVWERPMGGPVASRPVLAGEGAEQQLLVGTDNGDLFALDPADGSERWRHPTDGRIRNPALQHEGVVFVVNSRDQVFALDARTGAWRWQVERPLQTDFTVHGHAGLSFTAGGNDGDGEVGTLWACFDDGSVSAIAAASGQLLWDVTVAPKEGGNFVDCDTTPLVDREGELLFVAGQSTGVTALARSDGAERWVFPVRGVGALQLGPGGILIAVSSLEGVFALDRRGALLWRTQLDVGSLGEPAVVGDTVIITHVERGLVALDAGSGDVLDQLLTGSGMSSVPVWDPTTARMYAITNRGVLLGVRLLEP